MHHQHGCILHHNGEAADWIDQNGNGGWGPNDDDDEREKGKDGYRLSWIRDREDGDDIESFPPLLATHECVYADSDQDCW